MFRDSENGHAVYECVGRGNAGDVATFVVEHRYITQGDQEKDNIYACNCSSVFNQLMLNIWSVV